MERGVHFQNETSYSGRGGGLLPWWRGSEKFLKWGDLEKGGAPPMPTVLDEKFFLKIASTLLEYNEFKRINQLLFQLKSMILGGIKVN